MSSSYTKALQQIKAVGKDHKNTHFKYKYRSVDDIMEAVRPALVNNGLSLETDYEVIDWSNTVCKVKLTVTIREGSMEVVRFVSLGEGVDKGDKAPYKAMAGALKYALLQNFLIPTSEQKDPEADSTVDEEPPDKGDTSVADDQFRKAIAYLKEAKTLTELAEKRDAILQHTGARLSMKQKAVLSEIYQEKALKLKP